MLREWNTPENGPIFNNIEMALHGIGVCSGTNLKLK
jgi:hypothetical protein